MCTDDVSVFCAGVLLSNNAQLAMTSHYLPSTNPCFDCDVTDRSHAYKPGSEPCLFEYYVMSCDAGYVMGEQLVVVGNGARKSRSYYI